MSNFPRRAIKWVAVLLMALGFISWSAYFIFQTSVITGDGERYYSLFDDAMISMRYAWNLAHGDGLVWNPGERVEGFTNLLWTLVMSLQTVFLDKSDAVLAVHVSGVILLLVSAFFAMKVGEQLLGGTPLEGRVFLSVLFFVSALIYFPQCYWTIMGMETGLLSALIIAAVFVSIKNDGCLSFKPILPVLVGLAFLTRPDTAAPGAIIMLYRLSGIFRKKGWLRVILLESSIIMVFVIGVSIFRIAYYGSIVPNTYTLKIEGLPLDLRIENGFLFLEDFWITVVAPIAICFIGLIFRWSRRAGLLLGLFLFMVAYQIYVGGDGWKHWRITAPFFPLLLVLTTTTVALMLHRFGEGGPLAKLTMRRFVPAMPYWEHCIVAFVFALVAWQANDKFQDQATFEKEPLYVKANRNNIIAGLALADLAIPGASVGVTWAGTIPYYSGMIGIDFLGKSDKYIAGTKPDTVGTALAGLRFLPGHCKYDLHYSIINLKPTYVQMSKWGRHNLNNHVHKYYKAVRHKGAVLRLRKNSPHIRWEKVGRR